jgi:hypothetical protein
MRRAFFIVAIAITALGVMGQARPLVTVFDIGAGVRPVSLGEAFTGLADDEYALFYNPAGLATLTGGRASILYQSHFGASTYLSAFGSFGSIGGGLIFFDFGQVPLSYRAEPAVQGRPGQDDRVLRVFELRFDSGLGRDDALAAVCGHARP